MLPCLTFERSPEHDFLYLSRWIRKTSDLIENPSKVRDLLSQLTHKEVWYILDYAFFLSIFRSLCFLGRFALVGGWRGQVSPLRWGWLGA